MTDHLCCGSVDGTFSHDLLPLPYTTDVARACAENFRQIQGAIELPFAVENVSSCAEYRNSAMTLESPVTARGELPAATVVEDRSRKLRRIV